jgi:hypothetical protein
MSVEDLNRGCLGSRCLVQLKRDREPHGTRTNAHLKRRLEVEVISLLVVQNQDLMQNAIVSSLANSIPDFSGFTQISGLGPHLKAGNIL